MGLIGRAFLFATSLAFASCLVAHGQDSPPLGDVARQARQRKQDKDSQTTKDGNTAKTPRVITEDEIPSRSGSASGNSGSANDTRPADPSSSTGGAKQSAESWKSQIQAQKDAIATLQAQISRLNDSIQFAPANCVSGCVQWNERQQQKQQELERMRSQLDTLKQHMQEMQEGARQQGYGSSVYDPN